VLDNKPITIGFENGSIIKSLPNTGKVVRSKIRTYEGGEEMNFNEYSSDIINTETGKVVTTVTGTLDEVLNILKPREYDSNILDMVLPNGFSEEFKKELYIGAEVETIGNIAGNKVQTIRTKVIDLSNIDSGNIIVELIEVIISDK
jgi:hypothetical protein